MRQLVKHTIVIWSELELKNEEVQVIAAEAVNGEAYCSKHETEIVENPENDRDWDGTEFFGVDDHDDDECCQRCDEYSAADEVVILDEGPVCRHCVCEDDLEDENAKGDEEITAVLLTWIK